MEYTKETESRIDGLVAEAVEEGEEERREGVLGIRVGDLFGKAERR